MKKALTAILALSLIFFAACGTGSAAAGSAATAAPAQVKSITPDEARARLQSGDPLVLLDVRTAEEYSDKHIPGAVLLPNEEIGDTAPALLPVKDAEIIVYCRSGNRSKTASSTLAELGYSNIYEFGGINTWPYETEP